VQTRDDVLKLLLAGADVVMLASALLREGPGLLRELTAGVSEWVEEREYASIEQLKGSMSQETCGDPRAFERAQYVRALVDYQSHARRGN
jgi:dihydroorotate dehydrogenase (fumarate)